MLQQLSSESESAHFNSRPSTLPYVAYVDAGHYTGKVFHRVIPGFVIQGGGFEQLSSGSEPSLSAAASDGLFPPVENEAVKGLSNNFGTIAMARTEEMVR